jgi:hypothetical protein
MRRKKTPCDQSVLTLGGKNRLPKVTLSKNGTILFNSPASKLLNLVNGTRISFALANEEPYDWFVFLDPENGFELHLGSDKRTMLFTHCRLVQEFLKSYQGLKNNNTYKFLIDEDPVITTETKTGLWRIIVDRN